ncbi:LytR/AlgR family response regulator transcription factor [Pedobacter sp. AW1-32]|uniref:LytR/AlgR family response regulator transcription factor n=1 Tax=Pedobacter sp. AW1-32 TaxID=3383026 RepID=UPI003FF0FB8D
MSISCIAIDDDLDSLENLKSYLDKVPDMQLVKTFTEPMKALKEIKTDAAVDIIFLDVEMPALSGIELASLLRQKTKHLIFTTAHAKYAIDAFKVEADAYLLKPYSILHFAKIINNLYPTINQNNEAFALNDQNFFYIPVVNEGGQLIRMNLNDLIVAEELNEDIRFITGEGLFLSAKTNFNKMIKMLRRHPAFIQIQPTVIVAKQHIKSILDHTQVVITTGLTYAIDEAFKDRFAEFIQQQN